MKNVQSISIGVVCLLLAVPCDAPAQVHGGEWSVGFRGGANVWISSLNQKKIGLGGDLAIRYHFSDLFSLGITGGYEELKAGQNPVSSVMPNDYLKLKAIPLSLVGSFSLFPGHSFSPYVYLGIGGIFYKRINGVGVYVKENKNYSTIHIPVGLGFEAFTSKNVALSFDLGFRAMDAVTDDWRGYASGSTQLRSVPDAYPTAKAGIAFFFGGRPEEEMPEPPRVEVRQEEVKREEPKKEEQKKEEPKQEEIKREEIQVPRIVEEPRRFLEAPIAVVHFTSGGVRIHPYSMKAVNAVLPMLKERPGTRIRLVGYADGVGSDIANDRLSLKRGKAVEKLLVRNGVSSSRIETVGMGKREPVASDKTPEGRAKNRRVEIYLSK